MGYIYILKFSKPLGNEKHQAQYYIGYTNSLRKRLQEHRSGRGARITQVAIERGITIEMVYYTNGNRKTERLLKKRKNHKRTLQRAWKKEKNNRKKGILKRINKP